MINYVILLIQIQQKKDSGGKKVMDFKVIENPPFEFEDKIDDFVKQYNDPAIRTADIKEDLCLNNGEYNKLRREAINRGLCVSRNIMNKTPRYYHYNDSDGKYIVRKFINGKRLYFCSCKTEDEAKFMVSRYLENGWNREDTWKYKYEYLQSK